MKKKIIISILCLVVGLASILFAIQFSTSKKTQMALQGKLCQLMMLDFKYWGKDKNGNDIPFTVMNPTVEKLISKYQFGGIVLFSENIESLEQAVRLINTMQNVAKIPLLIGTDQEGGLVTRLRTGTNMPGNMVLGAANDLGLTKEVAKAIGEELKVLGINLNFAPVAGVDSSSLSPLGVRSFGSTPEFVGKMGCAYIDGLKEASVFSCVKHFPGLGNTTVDTHFGLATVNSSSYSKLLKTDLKPFDMCIQDGTDMVMVAHVIVPTLDNNTITTSKNTKIETPATFSHKIITGLLRDKFKFKGLVITDALDMGAIKDNFTTEEAVIKSILAGADMVLMPVWIRNKKDIQKLNKLLLALEKECKRNPGFLARVNESVKRIINFKKRIHINKNSIKDRINAASAVIGSKKHKKLAQEASSAGITLIKNDNHLLPLELKKNSKILILDASLPRVDTITKSIREISKSVSIVKQQIRYNIDLKASLKKKTLNADFIILDTYNLTAKDTLPEQIASFANKRKKKLVVIATRNPYDIALIPSCRANLAIYGATSYDITNNILRVLKVNLQTAVKMLFVPPDANRPLLMPTGKLPIEIKNPITNKILYHRGYGLKYN